MLATSLGASIAAAGPDIELTVYAAASLGDVLREIAPVCERRSGARAVFNIASSSDLARQILAANKADLFLSADEHWMEHVARAGLIDPSSRRSFLSNRLVVIAPADSPLRISGPADLADPRVRRLSMADPESVPAGRYARSWLESEGYWERIAERVVPTLDVRAALAAVEMGVVDAGIVYATDARTSKRVRVLHEVPLERAPRISYSLAALVERPYLEAARRFGDCLAGPEGLAAFERHGFITQ